jgi:hypothetical protein
MFYVDKDNNNNSDNNTGKFLTFICFRNCPKVSYKVNTRKETNNIRMNKGRAKHANFIIQTIINYCNNANDNEQAEIYSYI